MTDVSDLSILGGAGRWLFVGRHRAADETKDDRQVAIELGQIKEQDRVSLLSKSLLLKCPLWRSSSQRSLSRRSPSSRIPVVEDPVMEETKMVDPVVK